MPLLGKLGTAVVEIAGDQGRLKADLRASGKTVRGWGKGLNASLAKLAIGGAIFGGLAAGLKASVSAAVELNKGLAEVGTLLEGTVGPQLAEFKEGIRDLQREMGVGATDATKALYQAISAGVAPAKAMKFLASASRLAIGGVTDLTTAVDGTTSVLNAFGLEAGRVTDVGDAMFVAMKAGKTTIAELSDGLALAAPTFAAVSNRYWEMFAAVSAATKGGIKTKAAYTGLRQAMSNILKPTKDAIGMAAHLGIQFNAAAVQAMGFGGFINHLAQQMRGLDKASRAEAMFKLFGSVEASGIMLALTANRAKALNEILDQMTQRAGAQAKAYQTIKENDPSFVYKQFRGEVSALASEIGDALLPSLQNLVGWLRDMIPYLKTAWKWLGKLVNLLPQVMALKAGIAGWGKYAAESEGDKILQAALAARATSGQYSNGVRVRGTRVRMPAYAGMGQSSAPVRTAAFGSATAGRARTGDIKIQTMNVTGDEAGARKFLVEVRRRGWAVLD